MNNHDLILKAKTLISEYGDTWDDGGKTYRSIEVETEDGPPSTHIILDIEDSALQVACDDVELFRVNANNEVTRGSEEKFKPVLTRLLDQFSPEKNGN